MHRVVVLSTQRDELVIVMASAHSPRAEVMDVDEAKVRTAGDAAAVLIAERDAPPGGRRQRAQLEATLTRGDSPDEMGDNLPIVFLGTGRCGDGVITDAETCEDGNSTSGDGCGFCQVERGRGERATAE